jgi:hypothetical protein
MVETRLRDTVLKHVNDYTTRKLLLFLLLSDPAELLLEVVMLNQ